MAAKKKLNKFEIKKLIGDAPTFDGHVLSSMELIHVHNYFANAQVHHDDMKEYAIKYLSTLDAWKKRIKLVNSVKSYNFRSIGANCYVLLNGGKLTDDVVTRMFENIESYISKIVEKKDETKSEPVASVRDNVNEKLQDLIADIEYEIDQFWNETPGSDFKVSHWLIENDVKPMMANKIIDFYRPLYDEAMEIIKGKDAQLKEAYGHMKKSDLKKYAEFIKSILHDCESRTIALKVVRKPRKRKEKTPEQLTAKVQYLEKSDEYNLTSIAPVKIIKASQVWVFNTRSKVLTVYNAMGPSGLTVVGTTIKDFDVHTSIGKVVRKPDEVLKKLLDGGKIVLRKTLSDLKTVEKKGNGRLNKDTVIVRVIK